jgi:hypothetical protein
MDAWTLGFVIGAAVVVVVALLLTLILVGRRSAGDAEEAPDALRGVRDGTAGLWDLRPTTTAVERLTAEVAAAQGATSSEKGRR